MADLHSDFLDNLDIDDFDTILSPDIDFSGTIFFEKSLLIQGRVSGLIQATGVLVIDTNAVIEADINASKIVIRGSVRGNINATAKIEISATGKLVGNINAPQIAFEAGCLFNGLCTMPEKSA
ncbi:MAG: polymer-forming cytoskeletal protein [Spirochaetaceae bacterium]|jgi:cytoskeletal protein CcmA (bactofilin family)|nr:polymer-forming cytoskeletal protein [Spirochaetaceae bacterium]